jgi:hypothetical protein
MEYKVDASLPARLSPKAAARFSRLGYGAVAERRDIIRELGSARAGDQFIHTWSARGLVVPVAWGKYKVPEERVFLMALAAGSPAKARLVSWAATATGVTGRPRRLAFMAPVIWERTHLSIASPCPLIPLDPRDTELRPEAPQLEAFSADLGWSLEPLVIRVGSYGEVRTKVVSAADIAWILGLSKDPRLRVASADLQRGLSPRDRKKVREIARRAAFPTPTPTRSRPLTLPQGPPEQFRIFVPRWYMRPHLRALETEDRRSGHA